MKVKELIKKLECFDPELEVTITDGFEALCYHTNGCEIALFEDGNSKVVDVGIGGLNEN
jgi:hypothetical protein